MDSASYLEYILKKLSATHDIRRGYVLQGRADTDMSDTFPAYASYASSSEKYVLTRKAKLWTAKEYEHVLFMDGTGTGSGQQWLVWARELIADSMEPAFVRKGEKYPPRDHMRTFLTLVLVLDHSPDAEFIRGIRKYRFDRGYLFSIRGYAQGRIIAVDLSAEKVYASVAARDVAAFYLPAGPCQ